MVRIWDALDLNEFYWTKWNLYLTFLLIASSNRNGCVSNMFPSKSEFSPQGVPKGMPVLLSLIFTLKSVLEPSAILSWLTYKS